tara:strand:+ start:318 stop:482 length:165 start_codon:yes stop_codon:yes gene_type:complete
MLRVLPTNMESYFSFKIVLSEGYNTLGFLFLSFSPEAIFSADNQFIITPHSTIY